MKVRKYNQFIKFLKSEFSKGYDILLRKRSGYNMIYIWDTNMCDDKLEDYKLCQKGGNYSLESCKTGLV